MFLGLLFDIETEIELTWYFFIFCFILYCLLVHYAYRIKIMIQFYFERDGGVEWEKIKKSKNRGWQENSDE